MDWKYDDTRAYGLGVGLAMPAATSGMDLGLLTGAGVALAGCAVALAVLPSGRRKARGERAVRKVRHPA